MKTETKLQVSEQLKLRLTEQVISQNKAANAIGKTSATTINFIVNQKWMDNDKLISEEQWNRVAAWLGINKGWSIDESNKNYKRITNIAQHCQRESISKAIIGAPGLGKSQTLKAFSETRANVFYIECSEYWGKKVFLNKLKKVMGMEINPASISDMMDDVVSKLNSLNKPLIIIDEADKLKDNVINFFNSLYNSTLNNCGFLLAGAPYLKQRIEKGTRLNKQSYCEIFSRIGGEFMGLHKMEKTDVRAICLLNGIESEEHITTVVNLSNNDLRRVKNTVAQIKLEIEKTSK